MTKDKNGKSVRDYRREYDLYHSRPDQIAKRSERVTARREMEKAGKVSKGDGMDVDHKRPLSRGGSNANSNLRVRTSSANRSFQRNADGSVKRNGK